MKTQAVSMTREDEKKMAEAAKRLGVEVDRPMRDDIGTSIGEFGVILFSKQDSMFFFATFREAWTFIVTKVSEGRSVSSVAKVLW